jgi:RNA polymerase-binding transcription factor DksA
MITNRNDSRSRPLDPLQLKQLTAALREQRRFRLAQVGELEGAHGVAGDPTQMEITATLLRGARIALADIDAALDRAADGRYGTCTDCRQPIAVERLEILPMVATCMSCQRRPQARRPRTALR